MSEVKEYWFNGEWFFTKRDYDALAQQNEALQAECDRLAVKPNRMSSEITKLTQENVWLAQQLAAEKVKNQTLIIELQDKNGVLVDLRRQLVASQARSLSYKKSRERLGKNLADALVLLAARDKRLEEAVGLLRGVCEYADGLHGDLFQAWAYAGSTASRTDHSDEDYFSAKAFLSQSDEAKENDQ